MTSLWSDSTIKKKWIDHIPSYILDSPHTSYNYRKIKYFFTLLELDRLVSHLVLITVFLVLRFFIGNTVMIFT